MDLHHYDGDFCGVDVFKVWKNAGTRPLSFTKDSKKLAVASNA